MENHVLFDQWENFVGCSDYKQGSLIWLLSNPTDTTQIIGYTTILSVRVVSETNKSMLEFKVETFGTKTKTFDTLSFDGVNLFSESDNFKLNWTVSIFKAGYFSEIADFFLGKISNTVICLNDRLELDIFGNKTIVHIGSLVYFSHIDTPIRLSSDQNQGYIFINVLGKPWDLIFDGTEVRVFEHPSLLGYFKKGPYETKIIANLI
jgi:hypothetical protein